MSDPAIDLAALARGQGAQAHGPVRDAEALAAAITQAVDAVRAGALVVIDARVAPEYSRAVSSSLLKHLPAQN
jgi:hypothetical protein